jgi:hypothetical protein
MIGVYQWKVVRRVVYNNSDTAKYDIGIGRNDEYTQSDR